MGEKQGRSFNRAPSSFASVGYHVKEEFVVPARKTMKANRGGDLGSNVFESRKISLMFKRDTPGWGQIGPKSN